VSEAADRTKRASPLLHRVTAFGRAGMLSFCCEGQPLATIRSYGFPVRCPICQQMNPLRGEQPRRFSAESKTKERSE
jgi:hypothetical protein